MKAINSIHSAILLVFTSFSSLSNFSRSTLCVLIQNIKCNIVRLIIVIPMPNSFITSPISSLSIHPLAIQLKPIIRKIIEIIDMAKYSITSG